MASMVLKSVIPRFSARAQSRHWYSFSRFGRRNRAVSRLARVSKFVFGLVQPSRVSRLACLGFGL